MCGASWASAEDIAAIFARERDEGEEDDVLTGPFAVLRGCLGVVEVRKARDEGLVTTFGVACQYRMSYGASLIDTWERSIKTGKTRLWPFTSPSQVKFPSEQEGLEQLLSLSIPDGLACERRLEWYAKHREREWLVRAAGENQWETIRGATWTSAEDVAVTFAHLRDEGEENDVLTGPLSILRGCLGVVEVRNAGAAPTTTWGVYCRHRMQYAAHSIDAFEEDIKVGKVRLWPFTSPSEVQFPAASEGDSNAALNDDPVCEDAEGRRFTSHVDAPAD